MYDNTTKWQQCGTQFFHQNAHSVRDGQLADPQLIKTASLLFKTQIWSWIKIGMLKFWLKSDRFGEKCDLSDVCSSKPVAEYINPEKPHSSGDLAKIVGKSIFRQFLAKIGQTIGNSV